MSDNLTAEELAAETNNEQRLTRLAAAVKKARGDSPEEIESSIRFLNNAAYFLKHGELPTMITPCNGNPCTDPTHHHTIEDQVTMVMEGISLYPFSDVTYDQLKQRVTAALHSAAERGRPQCTKVCEPGYCSDAHWCLLPQGHLNDHVHVCSAERGRAEIEDGIRGVIEVTIPSEFRVRAHPSGGAEDLIGSLTISVAKMARRLEPDYANKLRAKGLKQAAESVKRLTRFDCDGGGEAHDAYSEENSAGAHLNRDEVLAILAAAPARGEAREEEAQHIAKWHDAEYEQQRVAFEAMREALSRLHAITGECMGLTPEANAELKAAQREAHAALALALAANVEKG